ncbi:hypothetical protein STEG23_031387 [Scotinomys teguina]
MFVTVTVDFEDSLLKLLMETQSTSCCLLIDVASTNYVCLHAAMLHTMIILPELLNSRTLSTILNKYGESGQPCLVPDFSGIGLSFSPCNLMLTVGLLLVKFSSIILLNIFSVPMSWNSPTSIPIILRFGLFMMVLQITLLPIGPGGAFGSCGYSSSQLVQEGAYSSGCHCSQLVLCVHMALVVTGAAGGWLPWRGGRERGSCLVPGTPMTGEKCTEYEPEAYGLENWSAQLEIESYLFLLVQSGHMALVVTGVTKDD